MTTTHKLVTLFAIISCSIFEAQASIIILAPTQDNKGSVEVQENVTFNVTTSGTIFGIYLDELVTTSTRFKNPTDISPQISFSLNGGMNQLTSGGFADNIASDFNNVTKNDGYFTLNSGVNVAAGDTLTLFKAKYTIKESSNFNQEATQTFNGQMFLVDGSGNRLSEFTSVPEPGAITLFLPAILLAFRRSRSKIVKS